MNNIHKKTEAISKIILRLSAESLPAEALPTLRQAGAREYFSRISRIFAENKDNSTAKLFLIRLLPIILLLALSVSCGKKEEKVKADADSIKEHATGKDELQLSDQQIQLGNITIDSIREHLLGEEIVLTGIIQANQNSLLGISARVMGRIEKLYVKTAGEYISIGQPLYEIYSEDLNLAIREMQLAAEKSKAFGNGEINYDKITQSARNKLLLYGLTEEQVRQMEMEKLQPYTVKIVSKARGVVYSVNAKEGNYVMEGGDVFQLADFSTVWVEAQVYSDYMSEIKDGMETKVTVPGFRGMEFYGKVSFVNPELNPSSKINTIRVETPNPNGEIKPGMQAYVNLLLKQKSVLSLPTDAVIKEGKGSTVWLQTEPNTFKRVMVHTGLEANGYTEILHGLKKGDLVVISGAYLLNSEYIFKKGFNPMEGHDMKNMQE